MRVGWGDLLLHLGNSEFPGTSLLQSVVTGVEKVS